MLYRIIWKNRETGGVGESGILFSSREHAIEVANMSKADSPWNDYQVVPTSQAA